VLDRFSVAQRGEQRELLAFDAAEVGAKISPVNNEKDLLWLKSSDSLNFILLRFSVPDLGCSKTSSVKEAESKP
jgi:hypothetical protein